MKTVLVVEDERSLIRILKEKLIHAKFNVETATNGEEAILLLGQKKIDLILLDLLLNNEIDGFTVLTSLRESVEPTPVIIISNLDEKIHIERAMELGAKDYLLKSNVTLNQIIKSVNYYLSL